MIVLTLPIASTIHLHLQILARYSSEGLKWIEFLSPSSTLPMIQFSHSLYVSALSFLVRLSLRNALYPSSLDSFAHLLFRKVAVSIVHITFSPYGGLQVSI